MIITEQMLYTASVQIERLLNDVRLDDESKDKLRILRKQLAHSIDSNVPLADDLYHLTFPGIDDAIYALNKAIEVRGKERAIASAERAKKRESDAKKKVAPKSKPKPKVKDIVKAKAKPKTTKSKK